MIAGKQAITLDELNISVISWLNKTANQRMHATTKEIPMQRWVTAKPFLLNINHNYTTNYGVKNVSITPKTKLIRPHDDTPLQYSLSLYDAIFTNGGSLCIYKMNVLIITVNK